MAACSFFFQAEDCIRDGHVTGVQTCALPISTTSIHMLLDLKERRNGSELTVFIRQSLYRDVFENLGNGHSLRIGFNDGQELVDGIQAELKQRLIDAGEVVMEGSDGDT